MYKKRFTKWGFQKNSKRSTVKEGECVRVPRARRRGPGEIVRVPTLLELAEDDSTMLMILTNVRLWSVSFFETLQPNRSDGDNPQQIPTESQLRQFKTKEANFAFKLVIDLLDRGHGLLAGRMARKAFLLAEGMLTLEGPALVWNLLELMHYMVTGHEQLFQILLGHLMALAREAMPGTHPFISMLRGLQRLATSLRRIGSASGPSQFSSSDSSAGNSHSSLIDPRLQSTNLSALLKRAWIINAEMLLHNFDPRLFPLYFRILYPTWDTCSIPAPARLIGAAKQWFCLLEAEHLLNNAAGGLTVGHHAIKLLAYTLPKEDKMLESLLTPLSKGLADDSTQIYEFLRGSSITAVQDGRHSVSDKKQKLDIDSTISLRMLAVLATAKVLESTCLAGELSEAAEPTMTDVPTVDPAPVASAIRTLIGLAEEGGADSLSSTNNVERMRAVVTLRGYGEGETDPQVVRDMWLLQDALTAAGRHEEAQEVERDAYRRMEKYIEDIPVDSV